MVFGAKLLLQQRRRVGDRLVGDSRASAISTILSPRPSSRKISSSRARHLRSRIGLDRCRRKCYGFGQMRRDEIFARGDLPHRLHQQAGVVALGNISLRAQFDSANHECRIVIHAEHDDLRIRIVLSDPPHQFETGEIRQVDVDDRDIGTFVEKGAMAGFCVARFVDLDRAVIDANNARQPETTTG